MKKDNLYWLIPAFLIILQAIFTFNSFGQIRYEDLAESARNPFWMQKGYVYDGVSTSVWWYISQDLIYSMFGYDLFTAKFLRLILWSISLICLFLLLKKYLGEKFIIPFLIIGLSPTLLFFNTLQTSYGLDLVYLPIVLLLLSLEGIWAAAGWFLAMVAWLTYPPFVFYLPALAWFGFRKNRDPKMIGASALAFLAPFLIALLWIKNKATFLNDPVSGSGVFRGAGAEISFDNFYIHLNSFIQDLFSKGNSYHFELATAEFSYFLPILSFLVVIWMSFVYLMDTRLNSNNKKLVGVILLTMVGALIITFLTGGLPGMRRYTPFLASFYALFILVWKFDEPKTKIVFVAGLILLFHHLMAFPVNFSHLNTPSIASQIEWFTTAETPQESLKIYVDKALEEDLQLKCTDQYRCRYSEIFTAVSGYCYWNKLKCHQILGYDFKTQKMILLKLDLWQSYYLEH